MPSERVDTAKRALVGHIAAFRTAADNTMQGLRAVVESAQASRDEKLARAAKELGPFAAPHIDAVRFAALTSGQVHLEPMVVEAARWADKELSQLLARGDAAFFPQVEPGQSLHDCVERALAGLGRAFQAARIMAQAAKGGSFRPAGDAVGFPFASWSKAERAMAPPLIVAARGADIKASALAEFLDGGQKIVLLVNGPAPAAPLARLITPNTFVAQSTDGADLPLLAQHQGAGIAAWFEQAAASFVHHPRAGGGQKVILRSVPKTLTKIEGTTVSQQQEELAVLTTLASAPGKGDEAVPTDDKVDKLAAWLLKEAGV